MILLVLFIVFFVLWLASTTPPGATTAIGPYGNWCALICVGILGLVVFHGRF